MMKTSVAWVGFLALCAAGCGDSGGSGGGGTGGGGTGTTSSAVTASSSSGASGDLRHSCDSEELDLCTDWAYPEDFADFFSDAQADCEGDGHVFGDTCDTTGAVGGCRTTDTGAPGITVTTWVFTGTEADAMAYCDSLTATFVSPP